MKVLIFDLDDTIYNEIEYVKSGFFIVAKYLAKITTYDKKYIFNKLISIEKKYGRGKVFDIFLKNESCKKKYLIIKKCIKIYRNHKPRIKIYNDVRHFLEQNKKKSLYIISDGNVMVQKKKVNSLKIKKYFKKIYLTRNYGIRNEKPSLFCFNKIKKRENCNYRQMVYFGDNPLKDFKKIKKKRILTIRLMRGNHKNVNVSRVFDAEFKIKNFYSLKKII
tara:strand:- start:74 stop:733 length:660 start_codon:yes stop_codon:yes gene_type:complete